MYSLLHIHCCCSVSKSCLILCSPMDCNTPGSSVFCDPLKFMSVEWLMLTISSSSTLFSLLSIFPSIRVFSNQLALWSRWPKFWSLSFCNSPFSECSGLIFFRFDWFDLLAVQGTLKSLLQHHTHIFFHIIFIDLPVFLRLILKNRILESKGNCICVLAVYCQASLWRDRFIYRLTTNTWKKHQQNALPAFEFLPDGWEVGSSITKELIILSKVDFSFPRPLRVISVLFSELCIFILVQLHKKLDKFYCLQNDSTCV